MIEDQLVSSSADSSGPLCPQCHRRVAAWRLDHCVYCGAAFPADFREGFTEPAALKWVERPALPADAARQLEVMKVIPLERKGRTPAVLLGLLSVPVFGVLFYLLYRIVARYSAPSAVLVLVAGAGFLGYLFWSLSRQK
jgi:hypothetical protein